MILNNNAKRDFLLLSLAILRKYDGNNRTLKITFLFEIIANK
jgi:hypothetical protein